MQDLKSFKEKCPKCNSKLLEIKKDYYPEYIETEKIEGFKHRYVCSTCGNEIIYNTITNNWTTIDQDALYHYGKKGNRLLNKTSKQYLDWIQRNWNEIREEFIEEIIKTGQVDIQEIVELEEWIKGLVQKEIILHLRQLSDELSYPDYNCSSQPTMAMELILLTQRLEELTD